MNDAQYRGRKRFNWIGSSSDHVVGYANAFDGDLEFNPRVTNQPISSSSSLPSSSSSHSCDGFPGTESSDRLPDDVDLVAFRRSAISAQH